MTLTEAAQRLELDPSTLRHQIARGALQARKMGRDWHVTDEAVEAYRAGYRGRQGRRPKA